MAPRPKTSLFKDSFRKRNRTVMHKVHELAVQYGAQVYLVVQFNGKYHTYNSVECDRWPLSVEKINQSFPLPQTWNPTNYESSRKADKKRNVNPRSLDANASHPLQILMEFDTDHQLALSNISDRLYLTEYPFDGENKTEREIKLSNFPTDITGRTTKPVRVERIFLSTDKNTLIGVCAVQNIAFHKTVIVRFTLDYWKTTSEVLAEYNNDPSNKPVDGCDRFNFYVKLSDLKNIEDKTLLLCVRYNVSGQEFWDNNENANYQVDFTKVSRKSSKPQMASGLGARPLNAIPRSRHSPTSTSRGRQQESLDDDFARRASTYSLASADNMLGESGGSIKLKPRGHRGSLFPTATDTPPSNGLGGRYDFGASLSAALTQAQEKISKQDATAKEKSSNGSYFGPIESVEGPTKVAKAEERPDAITTDRPAMGSDQYKDLVQKFCYFTPGAGKQAASPPQQPEINTAKMSSISKQHKPDVAPSAMDGAFEHADESVSSSGIDSGTSSPLLTNHKDEQQQSSSPIRSPFASRSASPSAPLTGGGMGGRAASPISFGYPYHYASRDGYLSDASSAPTAIQG